MPTVEEIARKILKDYDFYTEDLLKLIPEETLKIELNEDGARKASKILDDIRMDKSKDYSYDEMYFLSHIGQYVLHFIPFIP